VKALYRSLSRALGLPEWLPDPCGLAIRAPDAYGPGRHQDLLMLELVGLLDRLRGPAYRASQECRRRHMRRCGRIEVARRG
jgi:hypothetical protein